MKNYYQQKKDGWKLEPVIYAKTVKQIQCYRFFQKILAEEVFTADGLAGDRPAEKSFVQETQAEAVCVQETRASETVEPAGRQVAERYVQAVDRALERYVPEAYRDAVFAHMVDGKKYTELEETCFTSASTLKRYVQAFVWGVAEELGENF